MIEANSLKNQLIIAMPQLEDEGFHRSVVLICEHSEQGAMGIVINKPSDINLSEVFETLNIEAASSVGDEPVLAGGPIRPEQGFVLYEEHEEGQSEIVLSASKEVLAGYAKDRGPEKIIVALGYASWGGGQLENELAENDWLVAPANPTIIFDLPYAQRWSAAAGQIGLDFDCLASDVGHA